MPLSMDPSAIAHVGKSSFSLKDASLAFIPITSVALSLRMYVRIFIVKGFGVDDILLLVAQIMFLAFCGLAIHLINYEHDPSTLAAIFSTPKEALAMIEKLYTTTVLFSIFYVFSLVFLKLSLAFFYLRIIVQRWQRIVIYVTVTTMTVYGFTYAFTYLFRCGPDVNHQLINRAEGKCISDQILLIMTYVFGSLDTLTDFVYAFLPIYVLWSSNMPLGMKFTAGFLLCLGSVSSICALIRVATLSNLTLDVHFFKQAVQTGLWSIIEPGLAIVATSLAACRPLWRRATEGTDTGSFIKNKISNVWSSSKRSGGSSSSSRSTSKAANKANGLSFVERSEANKGFKKFNCDEYGVSTATVGVGDDKCLTELQDLGKLEAQDYFRGDDESDNRTLVRASMAPSEKQTTSKIFKTRDVRVDVRSAP